MDSPLSIGSLFSGIGGLELGLESCGLGPVLWQVEHDPFCRSILARHWPGAARSVSDVRVAGAANLAAVDLICAGFPCQPVSLAGRRKAREDARWLWPEVARIAGELGRPVLFLENVPGLLTADDGRAFGEVLGSLASLGYAAEWDCFRASDVGAPHRRERWFLLAYRDGERQSQQDRRERHERGRAVYGGEGVCMADAVHPGDARVGGIVGADARRVRSPRAPQATAAGCGGEDGAGGLADARTRRRAARRLDARARQSDADGRGFAGLADAGGVAPIGRQPQRVRGSAFPAGAGARGEGMGDAEGERRRSRRLPVGTGAQQPVAGVAASGGIGVAEPVLGRGPHGIPLGMDGPWPAGRGEPQHAWEPPRTAHKVTARPARLKALGNAVVPAEAALAWRVLWDRMIATGGSA